MPIVEFPCPFSAPKALYRPEEFCELGWRPKDDQRCTLLPRALFEYGLAPFR
jgi:hypothetical protein